MDSTFVSDMRFSKTTIIIIVIIAALAAIKFLFLNKDNEAAGRGEKKSGVSTVPVSAIVVKPVASQQVIYATGSITANEEVELHPEVAGKLVKIYFKEGSRVSKGSLLIKINDADLQAQLQKSNLQVKLAEENLIRNERLLQIKGISQQEYDIMLNQEQSYRSDQDVLRAQIAKTEIHAPFNGIIGLKSVSEGSYVTPQTAIASLQQIDPVKITFSVPEKYSSQIKVGDEIKFTVGTSSKEFQGKIYAIEPKVEEMTRSVQVRAICPNASAEVLPGAFARITLVLSEKQNALMVPTESIVPILKGQQVYVYRNGKVEAVKVDTGNRNDSTVEIINGLNAGDTVITTGIIQIRPGVNVKLTSVK